MAHTRAALSTSAKHAASVSSWKGILEYTAPSGVAASMPRPTVEFDATASTAPTVRVRVVLGPSSSAGSARSPVAASGNNPAGVSLGSGLENLSDVGTGGTVIREQELKGYGAYVLDVPPDLCVPPGTKIQIAVNATAAVNVQAGWGDIRL